MQRPVVPIDQKSAQKHFEFKKTNISQYFEKGAPVLRTKVTCGNGLNWPFCPLGGTYQ